MKSDSITTNPRSWRQRALLLPSTWRNSSLLLPRTWRNSSLLLPRTWRNRALLLPTTWRNRALLLPTTWRNSSLLLPRTWRQRALLKMASTPQWSHLETSNIWVLHITEAYCFFFLETLAVLCFRLIHCCLTISSCSSGYTCSGAILDSNKEQIF